MGIAIQSILTFAIVLTSAVVFPAGMCNVSDIGERKTAAGGELSKERITEENVEGPLGRTAIIAELVGLSTLRGFALLASPLLIPVFLAAFALFLLPLTIFPLPIAAIGRRLGGSKDGIDELLAQIVQSSKCLERISCEIGRSVKTPQVRTIIDQSFAELSGQLEGKWRGSLKGYVTGSNSRLSSKNVCLKFHCRFGKVRI